MNIAYYYNRIKNEAVILKKTYLWNNKESFYAVKAAISCILSILIAYSMEFDRAYWAGISSIIIMLPSTGGTIKKAGYWFVCSFSGALLAIFTSGLFAQNHILYSIAIFLIISISSYRAIFSSHGYFWFLFSLTAIIIMITSISQNCPEYIINIAFERTFEVIIGITVTSFLNIFVWPEYAAHEYYRKSVEVRKEFIGFVENVFRQYNSGKYNAEKTGKHYNTLKKNIAKTKDLLEHAKFEIKTARRQKSIIILDAEKLLTNLNHIWDFYLSIKKFECLEINKKYNQYTSRIIENAKMLLKIKNNFKLQGKLIEDSENTVNLIRKKYVSEKTKGIIQKYDMKDIYLFQEFILILQELVDFSSNKIFFNNKVFVLGDTKPVSYFPEEVYNFELFGMKKQISIPILKYSIKMGITVVLVIWLWQLFEIPSGGANMAVAVILILQPDIMSTYLKGILRFLGCLCGALAAFVFLGLQIQSTVLLCISLFIVIYISMYIYFKGGPAISYLGLQMAFAFFVAVLPEPHATLTTVFFLKRLLGIFFGVIIAWILNVTIMSKDLLEQFKEKLSFLENRISDSAENFLHSEQDNLIPDISSFYSSLDVLTGQKEIHVEDTFYINKYLKNIEKFFRIRYVLLTTGNDVTEFVNENIAISKTLHELIKNVNLKMKNDYDFNSKIETAIKFIEELKTNVRQNKLIDSKQMSFREEYCQYVINLKRLTLTLAEIYKLQEKV